MLLKVKIYAIVCPENIYLENTINKSTTNNPWNNTVANTNLHFIIPISKQPDCVSFYISNLQVFDLTEFII